MEYSVRVHGYETSGRDLLVFFGLGLCFASSAV
jgi:hypothetical protein